MYSSKYSRPPRASNSALSSGARESYATLQSPPARASAKSDDGPSSSDAVYCQENSRTMTMTTVATVASFTFPFCMEGCNEKRG